MRISLEVFILINLCMNFITIGIVARSRGHVRWGTVGFASAFGTLYAVAMQTQVFHLLQALPLRLVLGALLCICSMRVDNLRDWLSATGWLIGGTLLMGGVQMLADRLLPNLPALALVLGGLGGGMLLLGALEARAGRLSRLEVRLKLRVGKEWAELTALIDTGNRLHEPLSGLPVLIVEQQRIENLLPYGFDAAHVNQYLPPRFRLVGYGALGAKGTLAVFRPDELLVQYRNGWMTSPDMWVAIYPGQMPGKVHALAPGVLGCLQSNRAPFAGRTLKKQGMRGNIVWLIPRNRQSGRRFLD